jgi:hypothetical protein
MDMEMQSLSRNSLPLSQMTAFNNNTNNAGLGNSANSAPLKSRSFIGANLYNNNNNNSQTSNSNGNGNGNNKSTAVNAGAASSSTSILLKNFQTRNIKMMSLTIISITCIFIILTLPIMLFIIAMKLDTSSKIDQSYNSPLGSMFASLDPNCKSILWALVNIFMYTNHSINFVMYCLTGSKFRTELATLFLPRHVTLSNGNTNNVLSPHLIGMTMAAGAMGSNQLFGGGGNDHHSILSTMPLSMRKYTTNFPMMNMRSNAAFLKQTGQFGGSVSNHNINSILNNSNNSNSLNANKKYSPFNKVRSQSIFINASNDINNNNCLN